MGERRAQGEARRASRGARAPGPKGRASRADAGREGRVPLRWPPEKYVRAVKCQVDITTAGTRPVRGPPPMPDVHSAPPAPAASNRSALFIVFLVVVIDLLGFGIVL